MISREVFLWINGVDLSAPTRNRSDQFRLAKFITDFLYLLNYLKLSFIKNLPLYYILIFLFIGCKKENALDCFKSTGAEITEVREQEHFDYIEVYDKMEVTVFQGTECKVEVTAGKHIIKNISSKVENNVLKLENNNKCNFVRGYKRVIKVKITVPAITQISNYGVGPITMSPDFKQDKIFFRAENSGDTYINGTYNEVRTSSHGNGDMYLDGTTKSLLIYSYGTNFTYAEKIKVENYIFISTFSICDAFFDLTHVGEMEYKINDIGNIYYKGKSSILNDLSDNGAKGRAIQKD